MKNDFQLIKPTEIDVNYINLIGQEWMLVTAGSKEGYNMMTASWGGVGFLWNRPVVFIFIRPQRYTFEFIEREEAFTLSFFDRKYRAALNLCGTKSGREIDKAKETGLTPWVTDSGNISFEEAGLILECKKIYAEFFHPESFIDASMIEKVYADGDFHKVYVAEIVNTWEKK